MKLTQDLIDAFKIRTQEDSYVVPGLLKDFSYHALMMEDDFSETLAYLKGEMRFGVSNIISGNSRDHGSPLGYSFVRLADELYLIFDSPLGVSGSLEMDREVPIFLVEEIDDKADLLRIKEVDSDPQAPVIKKLKEAVKEEEKNKQELDDIGPDPV